MAHGRESSVVFSYMDGVPVKIGEKFKPPRKVTLPVGFQHRLPSESANDEYDFRLEHSVLEKIGEWRSLRKAATEKRKERIQAQELAWQDKVSEDVKKLALSTGVGQFENCTTENVATSSKTHSHPAVSSTTSHNFTFPSPILYTTSSSTSALNPTSDAYSNVESRRDTFNVTSSSSTPSHQNVQYSHRSSILTPVPISQSFGDISSSKSSSHFNISDFEADTSSPFDNMELKTINEMEELAHVLQPISSSPDNSKSDSSRSDVVGNTFSPQTSSFDTIQTPPHYCTVGPKVGKESMVLPHMNGMTGYNFYSTVPRSRESDTRNGSYVNIGHNLYNQPNITQELGGVFPYYTQQLWTVNVNPSNPESYHSSGNGEMSSKATSNISPEEHLTLEEVTFPETGSCKPLMSGMSFPVAYQQPSGSAEPGRSLSKSVPDIVQELEKELAEKRVAETSMPANRTSHTPPPRPNSFGSAGLEDWKPWPDLDSPEQSQSRAKKSPSKQISNKVILPNPFHELPPSSQQLAKHISEMGFSLPRVARACQMFGEDDKKVVEFLLQVQTLEEENWDVEMAEKALVLFPNISEAGKYLKALTQLLDLGFPEDKVSDALVKFQNDRDKALDHLIS